MRLLALGGAAVLASFVVGCGGARPPTPEPPSKRAQLAARRHVLVVPPDDVQEPIDTDGAIVVVPGGALDLARCALVCAGTVGAHEQIVGCFQISGSRLAERMGYRYYDDLVDCAIR